MKDKTSPITIEETEKLIRDKFIVTSQETVDHWLYAVDYLMRGVPDHSPDAIYKNNPEMYEKMKDDLIKQSRLYKGDNND